MKNELISVAEAARRMAVSAADVYRALRPLCQAGLITPHAGFTAGGKPCRLLDAEGMALLAKALRSAS